MATITAAKAGNWSDTTVWNGGVVPGNGDTADFNGFVIAMDIATIPASGTLLEIRSPAKVGQLTIALNALANRVINATTITPGTVGATGFIRVNDTTTNSLTINGNTESGPSVGIYRNSNGPLFINGNLTGGTGNYHYGLVNQTIGAITMIGNLTGGSGMLAYGLYNTLNAPLTITGNIIGGSGLAAYGVNNAGTELITLNNCNLINGLGAVAYSGIPPTGWNINPDNYIQWGTMKFYPAITPLIHRGRDRFKMDGYSNQ